jgi:hypothetical protein
MLAAPPLQTACSNFFLNSCSSALRHRCMDLVVVHEALQQTPYLKMLESLLLQ